MEHIIQFGVTIDEQKIIDHATNSASNKIVNTIQREIDKYNRGYDTKLEALFREEIRKVINENKDKIIDEAIKRLSANLARTKAVKDIVEKMVEYDKRTV